LKRSFYIIRHGQTDLNKRGIVQGRGIDSPINETGRLQAEAFYHHYKHVSFDRVITSTLQRTHQTVERFINEGIPWMQIAGLDEISWGIYEGKVQSEELVTNFDQLVSDWAEGKLDCCIEDGETPDQMKLRQAAAMEQVLEITKNDKNVLICTHGRAMRMLLCLLTDQSYAVMDTFPHTNTALYKVDYEDGKYTIDERYNVKHLERLEK